MTDPNILEEQLEYYRARAGEYDEWFLREGRYERGPEHRDAWFDEVVQVETALRNQFERFWTNVRASLKDGGKCSLWTACSSSRPRRATMSN
jgi:hypothetical protein